MLADVGGGRSPSPKTPTPNDLASSPQFPARTPTEKGRKNAHLGSSSPTERQGVSWGPLPWRIPAFSSLPFSPGASPVFPRLFSFPLVLCPPFSNLRELDDRLAPEATRSQRNMLEHGNSAERAKLEFSFPMMGQWSSARVSSWAELTLTWCEASQTYLQSSGLEKPLSLGCVIVLAEEPQRWRPYSAKTHPVPSPGCRRKSGAPRRSDYGCCRSRSMPIPMVAGSVNTKEYISRNDIILPEPDY